MLAIWRGRTESPTQWIPCYKCCKDYVSKYFPLSAHKREHVSRCACMCSSQTGGKKQKQTYGMLVFYIRAVMSQRRCLFPTLHLCDQCLQCCTCRKKANIEGRQLEKSDLPFYFPCFNTHHSCVCTTRSDFFRTIGHYVMIHLYKGPSGTLAACWAWLSAPRTAPQNRLLVLSFLPFTTL